MPFYRLHNYDLWPTNATMVTITLKRTVGVVLCKTRGIYADTSVFVGTNTLRGSYTGRCLDNNFWNVDILLNRLRKQHRTVKRSIAPRQHFPIKLTRPNVPMSAPGAWKAWGNQKCPSLLFHSRGKKNRRADQSVGMRRGMLPAQWPQWTPSLTSASPREEASRCPVTELAGQRRRRRRRKHASTVAAASITPLTLAWLRTAGSSQTKQQPHSCQSWNSASFQAIVVKEKICISVFGDGGETSTGEVQLHL